MNAGRVGLAGQIVPGRSGTRYLILPSGLLRRIHSDDPGEAYTRAEVEQFDGPLGEPRDGARLAAALRRAAHEDECHGADPARVTVLYDRADRCDQ